MKNKLDQNDGNMALSCSEDSSINTNQPVAIENKNSITNNANRLRQSRHAKKTETIFSCLCFSIYKTVEPKVTKNTEKENSENNYTV